MNIELRLFPNRVTAVMMTAAISATRSPYSTAVALGALIGALKTTRQTGGDLRIAAAGEPR